MVIVALLVKVSPPVSPEGEIFLARKKALRAVSRI
jgi:hypothetical protein